MKKSNLVLFLSIAGTVVLAAIGLALFILNQLGAEGYLADWPITVWSVYVAYGCLIGPIVIFMAIGLLRSGIKKSFDLHVSEVRAERKKRQEAEIRCAKRAYDSAAMDELLAAHPNLRN